MQHQYQRWGTQSAYEWRALIAELTPAQKEHLSYELSSPRLRGPTPRGTQWGGSLHELGDISPMQSIIIATAKPHASEHFILEAQKKLIMANMALLSRFTKLTGTTLSADNSIRINEKRATTQEEAQVQITHRDQSRADFLFRKETGEQPDQHSSSSKQLEPLIADPDLMARIRQEVEAETPDHAAYLLDQPVRPARIPNSQKPTLIPVQSTGSTSQTPSAVPRNLVHQEHIARPESLIPVEVAEPILVVREQLRSDFGQRASRSDVSACLSPLRSTHIVSSIPPRAQSSRYFRTEQNIRAEPLSRVPRMGPQRPI